jgi:hypothetical protein
MTTDIQKIAATLANCKALKTTALTEATKDELTDTQAEAQLVLAEGFGHAEVALQIALVRAMRLR